MAPITGLLHTPNGDMYDYFIKCIVVGDTNVGKTTLCNLITTGESSIDKIHEPTIGAILYHTYKQINNNKWKIYMWDTPGYYTFDRIIGTYYKTVAICILVFDVTDVRSFEYICKRVKKIKDINPYMFIVAIGNKNNKSNDNPDIYEKFFKTLNIPYYLKNEDVITDEGGASNDILESIISKFYKEFNLSDKTEIVNDENLFQDCITRTGKDGSCGMVAEDYCIIL